jgi:hypothetical protein
MDAFLNLTDGDVGLQCKIYIFPKIRFNRFRSRALLAFRFAKTYGESIFVIFKITYMHAYLGFAIGERHLRSMDNMQMPLFTVHIHLVTPIFNKDAPDRN